MPSDITPLEEWMIAEQVLMTLREPAKWRETVIESIVMDGDRLFRNVDLTLAPGTSDLGVGNGSVHLVVMKPRKGLVTNVRTLDSHAKTRMFSHREHIRLTQWMVLFRLMSIVDELDIESPGSGQKLKVADLAEELTSIPAEDDAVKARATFDRLFDVERSSLKAIRGYPDTSQVALLSKLLFRLCDQLVDRYFKIVRIETTTDRPMGIKYSYDQDLNDRSSTRGPAGVARKGLRAPSSAFYIHVPMARLTDHYEFTMSPISGYYVFEQRVTLGPPPSTRRRSSLRRRSGSGKDALVAGIEGPWVAREPGRAMSPTIFVGDGTKATQGMHVGIRLFEIPPGATGHAFASHVLTFLVAFALVMWSLSHNDPVASSTAGLLAGILAIGSTAVDWLIPRVAILNAPLLPRLLLFSQAVLMAGLAVWMLTRGSVSFVTSPPPPGFLTDTYEFFLQFFGPLVLVGLFVQVSMLTFRVIRTARAYNS